jgi:hypothetical protein
MGEPAPFRFPARSGSAIGGTAIFPIAERWNLLCFLICNCNTGLPLLVFAQPPTTVSGNSDLLPVKAQE